MKKNEQTKDDGTRCQTCCRIKDAFQHRRDEPFLFFTLRQSATFSTANVEVAFFSLVILVCHVFFMVSAGVGECYEV